MMTAYSKWRLPSSLLLGLCFDILAALLCLYVPPRVLHDNILMLYRGTAAKAQKTIEILMFCKFSTVTSCFKLAVE